MVNLWRKITGCLLTTGLFSCKAILLGIIVLEKNEVQEFITPLVYRYIKRIPCIHLYTLTHTTQYRFCIYLEQQSGSYMSVENDSLKRTKI